MIKGDVEAPNSTFRFVAKEYKADARPDWRAATPPVECMRLLISKAAESKSNKVLYVDISRVYLYAKSIRPTYIKFPSVVPRAGEEGVCGKLLMSTHGTRYGAQNWSKEYTQQLMAAGYSRGIASP